MGWRRGDVWLETDVLWFRELGIPELPPLPPPEAPPGLAASRRRRDEWKRRRKSRRTRAAVLAVSPAVVLPLGAVRNAAGAGPKALLADPPSLILSRSQLVGDRPAARPIEQAKPKPKPKPRKVSNPRSEPKIAWHRATSTGLPFAGSLVDGTQLPTSGPDWVTWNPVTDSVPNEAYRLYGNELTIRAILHVSDRYRAANPGAPRIVVGDISRKGGGPLTDEHVSHQNGLDVDVYYPRRDRKLRAPTETSQIDLRLSQDLVDRFVAAGAQMIFVGFNTGLRGPGGIVMPYANHENHMHVRFP